jgi:hypothetical protein
MARQTSREGMVVFEQVWHQLLASPDEDVPAGNDGQLQFCDQIVAEALRQLAPDHSGKVALAVDNSLSENLQDMILGVCSRAHLSSVDLLWRPVAILLDYLDRNSGGRLTAQSRVLVVDAESSRPEATLLELREIDGTLVPVRRFFREDQDTLESDWRSVAATKTLAERLTHGTNIAANELLQGAFAAKFYRYRDGEHVENIWVKSGAEYVPLVFQKELDELLAGDESLDQLINSIGETEVDLILWHGWTFRTHTFGANGKNVIMPADSVSRGCRVYAERVEHGLPTYLEVMPSLEIIYLNPNTNRNEYDEILEAGEHFGGNTIPLGPINLFSLDRDVTILTIVLRRGDWGCSKQVAFEGIPRLEEPEPVTITGEIKPGQGKGMLWISPRNDEQENLFGERRRIEINWDTMIVLPEKPQQSPDVYPEAGRIFGAGRGSVITGVENLLGVHATRAAIENILKNPEWLFGTTFVDGDDEVISLAARMADKIFETLPGNSSQANRHKLLNYMMAYAPEIFLKELREIYAGNGPVNIGGNTNWNTVFAPGRVFSTTEDVTLFLEYLVRSSAEDSWPQVPDISCTAKYFWSIFRSLCYHETAAEIDCDLAESVCRRICNYIEYRNHNNWASVQGEAGQWARGNVANSQKFCLCAILFLLRVRQHNCPGFLRAGDDLTDRAIELIEAMPRVRFVSMGFDNVNQLVLNFIRNEALDADYQAVRGLVADML